MPRKVALVLVTAAVIAGGAAPAHAATMGNWDRHEQAQAVRAGLMQKLPDGFEGGRPITSGELTQALTSLSARTGAQAVHVSSAQITVTGFDALLVDQLGLADAARTFETQARRAGLRPPSYFGTEVVARLLGLRYNHLSPEDDLELYPSDLITRAEAAYSFAQVLRLGGWEEGYAQEVASRFVLPHYTWRQRRALRLAVSKIGMPYVWGGETDGPSFGQVHGGYDCSGFAWRVFKLSGNPAGRKIQGRTAAQQAGEIPKSQRLRLRQVEPGDLLFFGSAHFRSRATEANIIHEGIALSPDFAIHSSSQGVYVLPLYEGWLHDEFAWARRVL